MTNTQPLSPAPRTSQKQSIPTPLPLVPIFFWAFSVPFRTYPVTRAPPQLWLSSLSLRFSSTMVLPGLDSANPGDSNDLQTELNTLTIPLHL